MFWSDSDVRQRIADRDTLELFAVRYDGNLLILALSCNVCFAVKLT